METVKMQQISMNDLMERAGNAVFKWISNNLDVINCDFIILCGFGNNGGDGLVLARLLKQTGAFVKVFIMNNQYFTEDNLINQDRLAQTGVTIEFFDAQKMLHIPKNCILIDALFGYGLNRPIDQVWNMFFEQINQAGNQVISIDIPSGMYCDRLNSENDLIIQSDICLTFESPKLSMFWPENAEHLQNFEILEIGFSPEAVEKQNSNWIYANNLLISKFKKVRKRFAYKYNFGNVLVIGGSHGKMGAVHLCSKAVMRSGAGLVTAYIPKCGETILQTTFPEAMLMTDFSENKIIGFPNANRFDTLAIGPGIGTDEKTAFAFEQFLTENDLKHKKLIVDADGINLIAQNQTLLKLLPPNTVLTPHDKELERLVGKWNNTPEKIEKIMNLVESYQLVLVSKGAFSQIFLPDKRIFINSTGNPGMATAGAGDVLTGIIAGLMGAGYEPGEAAVLGNFLHGKSGDLAAENLGMESLIASDIIDFLPQVFQSVFNDY